LTPREIEALRLVAHGMSDAQVADKLVVSERTVHSIFVPSSASSRSAHGTKRLAGPSNTVSPRRARDAAKG
jgi:FixJ family two-component response regulator